MNNYNKNTEHESIEFNIYRDYDFFNPGDYVYVNDIHNMYPSPILKDIFTQNPLDKRKLLKEKKQNLLELADFIIENFFGSTLDTHILVKDFKIEKYFFNDYKLYRVYGYCQGDLTYFIDKKGADVDKLTYLLYNAPLDMIIRIDDAEYYENDIMDDICYDIDELKDATIKFLKEKNYSQYVIDWIDNNFKERNY